MSVRGGFKVEGLLGHALIKKASDNVSVCSVLQPHPHIVRSTSANH